MKQKMPGKKPRTWNVERGGETQDPESDLDFCNEDSGALLGNTAEIDLTICVVEEIKRLLGH